MDKISKERRSNNMRKIKSANTKPELLLRKELFKKGFRYRINVNTLPGKPDIVLKKYNSVIFVNGCFWHGHKNCKDSHLPKTRTEWWKNKIESNKKRDAKNILVLKKSGWNVITVWGCQLKAKKVELTLQKTLSKLKATMV